MRKSSTIFGVGKYERAIKEEGRVTCGLDQHRGRQALQVSPRRDLRCGHERRAEFDLKFDQPPNVCVICFNTVPWSTPRKTYTSGTEQVQKPGFAVHLHTYRRERRQE